MRPLLYAPTAFALLAACHGSMKWGGDAADNPDRNVHVAMTSGTDRDKLAINLPGFNGSVTLPSLNLGAHVDLDGMKLAPGTTVRGVDVAAGDKAEGRDRDRVRLDFANPRTPADLVRYYRQAAADGGWRDVAASASGVTATKAGKTFALDVRPDGGGSVGRIIVGGHG